MAADFVVLSKLGRDNHQQQYFQKADRKFASIKLICPFPLNNRKKEQYESLSMQHKTHEILHDKD